MTISLSPSINHKALNLCDKLMNSQTCVLVHITDDQVLIDGDEIDQSVLFDEFTHLVQIQYSVLVIVAQHNLVSQVEPVVECQQGKEHSTEDQRD